MSVKNKYLFFKKKEEKLFKINNFAKKNKNFSSYKYTKKLCVFQCCQGSRVSFWLPSAQMWQINPKTHNPSSCSVPIKKNFDNPADKKEEVNIYLLLKKVNIKVFLKKLSFSCF